MRWITSLGVFIIGAVVLTAFPERSVGFAQSGASLPVFGYTVVHSFPHDHDAFTQGLQFVDGVFSLFLSHYADGSQATRLLAHGTGHATELDWRG